MTPADPKCPGVDGWGQRCLLPLDHSRDCEFAPHAKPDTKQLKERALRRAARMEMINKGLGGSTPLPDAQLLRDLVASIEELEIESEAAAFCPICNDRRVQEQP